jgi:hypothetical protein
MNVLINTMIVQLELTTHTTSLHKTEMSKVAINTTCTAILTSFLLVHVPQHTQSLLVCFTMIVRTPKPVTAFAKVVIDTALHAVGVYCFESGLRRPG